MFCQHFRLAYFLFLINALWGCHPQTSNSKKITIATAANMQFAMKALTEQFSQTTGIGCDMVISSSGKLTAQIKEGAPYDIFVAANMKYPEEVFKSGLAVEKPIVYAHGKLVLWTMVDQLEPSLISLDTPVIRHIALANPRTAPYGAAALAVIKQLRSKEVLEPKLVYGESIAQTNQFIVTEAAEVGFTAMSVVRSPQMNGKGQWTEVDPTTYDLIEQGVALLKHSEKTNASAEKFYRFLLSEEAKSILMNFGYSVAP